MAVVIETENKAETQRVARMLGQSIDESVLAGPVVLALAGELGSGKTAFVQGFARALGVSAPVRSPTFVLIKTYALARPRTPNSQLRTLVHIDCYRLKKPRELLRVGFQEIIKNPGAIILIEWADRVRGMLPRRTLWLKFKHGRKSNERVIKFEMPKP